MIEIIFMFDHSLHQDFGKNHLAVSSCMMEETSRYGAWMCEVMQSHLRGHVLEVGCGSGNYTEHYANVSAVERVTAIDLDPRVIEMARKKCQRNDVRFEIMNLHDLADSVFDCVVCSNVMEHIDDDRSFVSALHRVIKKEGTLILVVPAHQKLYARYDLEAGHYRRYSKKSLRSVLSQKCLILDQLFYFNFFGALGWWYAFKFHQQKEIQEERSRAMIRVFDRLFLPLGRFIEQIIKPPVGLSVIALCHKVDIQ
jgi:ubiquinone/menaquinone biosynthesis C-methylase UbiE